MASRNTSNIPAQTPRGGTTGPQSQPVRVDDPDMGTNDVPHAMRTTENEGQKKPGVYHVSQATERRITEQDWLNAGIGEQKTVIWDGVNEHYRELSDFTEGALELLRRDDSFRIVEANSSDDNN